MIHLSKEELVRLAELSVLRLSDAELEKLRNDLEAVIGYAAEVINVPVGAELSAVGNVNVFREDKPVRRDPDELLATAPHVEEGYFVVPKVLD